MAGKQRKHREFTVQYRERGKNGPWLNQATGTFGYENSPARALRYARRMNDEDKQLEYRVAKREVTTVSTEWELF